MRLFAMVPGIVLCSMLLVAPAGGAARAEDGRGDNGRADAGIAKLRATGLAAYNAGDYAEAKKAFDAAFRIAPLHSLGLWGARTRVKLGEWVEADERYERVAKAPVSGGDRGAEEDARQTAVREREELRHRMPRLRIRLEGLGTDDVEVELDGVPVSSEYLLAKKQEKGIFPHGKSLVVNPGDHRIVGVSGEQRKELSVSVAEGQTRDVNLRFINPDTLRQRKCSDKCKTDCSGSNKCYVDCKHRCFTEHD
jgi:tetratricopeptide (TPR) repeat protein